MSNQTIQTHTLGEIIRAKRESLGLLLRHVSAYLDIDQAILSKIERGLRKPTKENIAGLAEVLDLDHEFLLIQFMSDKIVEEVINEECANQVLETAMEKVNCLKPKLVEK